MFTMFDVLEPRARDLAAELSSSLPAVPRLSQDGDDMLLTVDLPGVAREDLRLTRTGRAVRLEATRRTATGERRIARAFRLPDGSGEVTATLRDGVLTLRIARSPEGVEQELQVH